ncbi:MAG TPA: hypothetical protein VJ255_19985, partial [Candidatus Acidoferrum sp.]|nr:hypothetical protein [Candidatus Acidoferrum sp.]
PVATAAGENDSFSTLPFCLAALGACGLRVGVGATEMARLIANKAVHKAHPSNIDQREFIL